MITFAASMQAAGKLKDEVPGKWKIAKIETSEPTLNSIIQSQKLKNVVEFTEAGDILIDRRTAKIRYSVVNNKKLVFSGDAVKKISKPEVDAKVEKSTLTISVPADLTSEILLMAKDLYLKSGGDKLIAALLEGIASSGGISATVSLTR
jgi:hypothetical protein